MPVCAQEFISRFAVEKSYYTPSMGEPKAKAFQPNHKGETSVFRTSNLSEPDIWALGNAKVAVPRSQPLKGRIDIQAFHIFRERLTIDADPLPSLHANITGWPNDPMATKSACQALATVAELYLVQ